MFEIANKLKFVKCILCKINKAKDYSFTLLAKKSHKRELVFVIQKINFSFEMTTYSEVLFANNVCEKSKNIKQFAKTVYCGID